MNTITLIKLIIVIILWLFNIFGSIWFVRWMSKNSILIQISEYKKGVFLSRSGRYRVLKIPIYKKVNKWYKKLKPTTKKDILRYEKRYFRIWDYFGRKPLSNIDPDKMEKYYISTESLPIIGIKTTLKLKIIYNEKFKLNFYVPWKPNLKISETEFDIENIMLSWSGAARTELYESTKTEMSKEDIINRVVLPLGLIVLAMACLIFFPKMYAAIMSSGNEVAKSAIDGFTDLINKAVPIG